MRIPYFDPAAARDEETRKTVADLEQRRAPGPLLPLDLALLHSLPAARGWNYMLGQIRSHMSLSDTLREVVMCRVGVLNKAVFEWEQHAPLALQAGVTRRFMTSLLLYPTDPDDYHQWLKSLDHLAAEFLDGEDECARLAAAVAYADQSTVHVQVDDAVFARLKQLFNNEEIVDLTTTIAIYNTVSRFLVALDVAERNGTDFADPEKMTIPPADGPAYDED